MLLLLFIYDVCCSINLFRRAFIPFISKRPFSSISSNLPVEAVEKIKQCYPTNASLYGTFEKRGHNNLKNKVELYAKENFNKINQIENDVLKKKLKELDTIIQRYYSAFLERPIEGQTFDQIIDKVLDDTFKTEQEIKKVE